ncbi:excinuclease ABC subunit B, partial [Enterococcus faecalis]|nr:excinuclease ABC subunit B [Enterococcus faecalis]
PSSLLDRTDVIVVAPVFWLFGIGGPREYSQQVVSVRGGMEMDRNELLKSLVDIQCERNDIDFQRGRFRVRGDVVDIFRASRDE